MNYEKLKGVIPDSRYVQLPVLIDKFHCNTPLRMAHFLSQAAHESANFTATVENLNYSETGLLGTFKKYFTSQAQIDAIRKQAISGNTVEEKAAANARLAIEMKKKLAVNYAKKPEMIANVVYANRYGNGDTASGDGWKYRGQGDLQTTFLDNYKAFKEFSGVDVVAHPELLQHEYSLSSAGFFFEKNRLWAICDLGATKDVVTKVRIKVNGGTIGLDDVYNKFIKFNNLLNGTI